MPMSETDDSNWRQAVGLKTLDEIAIARGTDKATLKSDFPNGLGHGYAPHYDLFFTTMRDSPIKLLEIGVGGGESIRLWLDYFPNAKVFGVDKVHDTNPWNKPGENDRYTFINGDQSCETFWGCFLADYGDAWDVIVDDGSHVSSDIMASFRCLWPSVKSGGLYCIEDLKVAPEADQWLRDMLGPLHQGQSDVDSIYAARELFILKKP